MFHALLFLVFSASVQATTLPPAPTPADFHATDPADVEVGQLLFFDRILSGNRNISCATCHHPGLNTSDGLSLGIGEGGMGLGPARTPGSGADRIKKRVPRNSQALFNLGARELHTMFHDGRLSESDLYGNGFNSPAEEWLPGGLDNLLAAQALFPLVAQFEMAGNLKENEVIGAVHDRIDAAWPIIAARVAAIPAYAEHFIEHKAHISTPGDITIVDIANALSAFINATWQRIDTPFDRHLRGDSDAMSPVQLRGMSLFYGKANCASCHSGMWLSDQEFHALGLPAFGPGRTRRFNLLARDLGRLAETDDIEDAYAFRTPMLRNVALTAPYGHNGAWPTLDGIIRQHLDPAGMRAKWTRDDANLIDVPWLAPVDFIIQSDRIEMARQAAAVPAPGPALTDDEIASLVAFMHALTDDQKDPDAIVPDAVPSGLPVDRMQQNLTRLTLP
ncbi:MAG: cytochrome c peroxidase [Pseudomonadota bacterium]